MKRNLLVLLVVWPFFLQAQGNGDLRGAVVPYTRYESEAGRTGGGAALRRSTGWDQAAIASEASGQRYIALGGMGDFVEWTIAQPAQGLDLRFTLPDDSTGAGGKGVLSLYVNRVKKMSIEISFFWAYQYFRTAVSDPYQTPQQKTFMRWDEVHFRLDRPLAKGDTLCLQKDQADGLAYGI